MLNLVEVKLGNQLKKEEIINICKLKNQHWPMDLKKQIISWFILTHKNDKLLSISFKENTVAFLRLKLRKIIANKKVFDSYTLSEVCIDKEFQGKGLGTKIIKKSQDIIMQKKIPGYLLCESNLINFYKKLGWKNIKNIKTVEKVNAEEKNLNHKKTCFFYNLLSNYDNIKLVGKMF